VEDLVEEGRFARALAAVEEILGGPGRRLLEPEEEAWLRFERGSCLDRAGREAEADAELARAAALAPEEFPLPLRLEAAAFDRLVAEALDSLPERFDPYLRQVVVAVRDYPARGDPDPHILGLYVGVPRTERGPGQEEHLDQVFIFKRNLELMVRDAAELREEIRKTVVHEIAHHFGLGEEDMGEYA
jgi:predicted Zn-dependent protease with MMP-like domain